MSVSRPSMPRHLPFLNGNMAAFISVKIIFSIKVIGFSFCSGVLLFLIGLSVWAFEYKLKCFTVS